MLCINVKSGCWYAFLKCVKVSTALWRVRGMGCAVNVHSLCRHICVLDDRVMISNGKRADLELLSLRFH